jgi:hypothetical protein
MPEPDSAPKVLVSYSHDSPGHMARVLALSDRLRAEGVDSQIDQYETSPPEGWPRWTLNRIEWADFVLVVCTATYNRRFRGLEEKGKGRGVNWEGVILTQDLYDAAAHNTKFIPVVFDEEDAAHIPLMLRGATFYVVSDAEGYEALYRRLTGQPRTLKPDLGKLRPLPQRTHQATGDERAWPSADSAAAFAPGQARPARVEGDPVPLERPSSGKGRPLIPLALAVLAAAAVAALLLWRFFYTMPDVLLGYQGKVVADNGGRAIKGARVSVEPKDGPPLATSSTDSEGEFKLGLKRLPKNARIRVEAEGFRVFERDEEFTTGTLRECRLIEAGATPTPTPTPTPSPAPTRRPIIPRPSPHRIPCTIERKSRGLCE